jgi:D-3-phosphoglycerate dehydrogenase
MEHHMTDTDTRAGGTQRELTILLLDPVHPVVRTSAPAGSRFVERYGASGPAEAADLAEADVIVLRSGAALTADMMRAAPGLRAIIRAGAGLDNIDLAAATAQGVPVCSVPGGSANAVAELAVGLAIGTMRHVALADRQLRAGSWRKHELMGAEIAGSTVGVLGFGAIGSRIGAIASALGARVIAAVGSPSEARRAELAAQGVELVARDEVAARAGLLFLALPLDADTRGVVDAAFLARMPVGAYLVNVSRGGIVDERALADALASGRLAGAATDVHEVEGRGTSPLAALDDVVLTPHIGGMTAEAQERVGRVVSSILAQVARGDATLEGRVA